MSHNLFSTFFGGQSSSLIPNDRLWVAKTSLISVKDFFLTSLSLDLGGFSGNEMGVIVLDLKIITLKFGLAMNFNFTSIIGLTSAYYILRYFR